MGDDIMSSPSLETTQLKGDDQYISNARIRNMTELEYYYNYIYDADMDSSELTSEELRLMIPVSVFYGLMFLLGTIGNILVIYCIAKYKRMKSITNQLLLSLACADLLLTLFCVPIKLAELFSFGWELGAVLCKLVHYIQVWTMVTSVMTLTAISLERYYAISRPLRAKYICTTNHTRIVILTIWIASSVFALPTIFVQSHSKQGEFNPIYRCTKETWDPAKKYLIIGYEAYMLFLLFFVPLLVMASAYCGVCVELWAVTESSTPSPRKEKYYKETDGTLTEEYSAASETTVITRVPTESKTTTAISVCKSHNKEAQIRQQVLNMLITVVAIFILCWGPLLSYNLVISVGAVKPYLPTEYPYAKILNTCFSLLAYMNSCLNPIIYGFMSRYFRKSFTQALSSCCRTGYGSALHKGYIFNDRSTSSMRKPGELLGTETNKRNTITTTAADSTLSRSPPISPTSTYQRPY